MKNIVTIISALLFIACSGFLDMYLSDGNVPVVIKEYAYDPVSANLCNVKTESSPYNKCNSEKQVEDAQLENARFASVRKIFSRHTCYAPLIFLSKHSATLLPQLNSAKSNYVCYTVNNLPLHIRNCIWLI